MRSKNVAVVKSIEAWPVPKEAEKTSEAGAGQFRRHHPRSRDVHRAREMCVAGVGARERRPASAREGSGWNGRRLVWARACVRLGTRRTTRGIVSANRQAWILESGAPSRDRSDRTMSARSSFRLRSARRRPAGGQIRHRPPSCSSWTADRGRRLVMAIRSLRRHSRNTEPPGSVSRRKRLLPAWRTCAPRFAALPPAGRLALLRDEIERQGSSLRQHSASRGSGHPAT